MSISFLRLVYAISKARKTLAALSKEEYLVIDDWIKKSGHLNI